MVRLPRRGGTAEPRRRPPAPAAPVPRLDGVRVLVVEDDFDARVLIRRMLEDAGAQVTDASDVDAALACIERCGLPSSSATSRSPTRTATT